MNFETSITYILTQLSVAYRTRLESAMNEIGLHSGQTFILISLWKNDGQGQIELANNLKLTAPTINKMIKSLEKNGYVDCRKCSKDTRMVRIFLTEKGISCQSSVETQWNKIETSCYSSLTETEKLLLTQLLSKLRVQQTP